VEAVLLVKGVGVIKDGGFCLVAVGEVLQAT
jgi:hypothetical protein